MIQILVRFLVGGAVVSMFAIAGDLLKPKSFAGLFGAAPSVALASLGLAIAKHGGAYAAIECRSMLAGAVALGVYSAVVCVILRRTRRGPLAGTLYAYPAWFGVAFGSYFLLFR